MEYLHPKKNQESKRKAYHRKSNQDTIKMVEAIEFWNRGNIIRKTMETNSEKVCCSCRQVHE